MCFIGISLREFKDNNKVREVINQTYINALNKYNVVPIFLSISFDNIETLLGICDGFILTGGTDVNPIYYKEDNTASEVSKLDDDLDILVTNYAFKYNKPILGICRGMQSINVFLGGSLNQEIKDHADTVHQIIVNKDTLLGKKLPDKFTTNSYHHQSIKQLAPKLIRVASSLDNTIEVFEHSTKPIIGVQFHPELTDFKENKYVLDYFITLVNVKKYLKNDDKIYPLR